MAGYVHVYTGDGKGKTTAAMGLAVRAAGAGWRVFIAQFAKAAASSELGALERLSDLITIRQYGRGCRIGPEPHQADVDSAQSGLVECEEALRSGEYSLVILDEANTAPALGLFSIDELLHLVDARPEHVELVITGRWAHHQVINRAQLVTEMREMKHYYQQGVVARAGIDK